MGVERYGSKTDVVVKLVLVFFIALFAFSLGTLVGKKLSDNEHALKAMQPGTPATEHASSQGTEGAEHSESRGVASVSPDAHEVKPEKALTDEEIAKLAEEFVTDDEKSAEPAKGNEKTGTDHSQASAAHAAPEKTAGHAAPAAKAPAHAPANAQAAPAANTHAAPAKEVLKPAARMVEGKSPIVANPPKVASRIPSALPSEVASSAVGKYTVQVAAYTTEKEAQSLAADLKAKGFSAFYVSAKVKGQTYYRVSVGLFTTTKEADAYKKDLIERAKVSSAIVQKITSTE